MLLSRVKTGIPGFDDLVRGGFPRGFSILLTGGTGTGKSTFAMQFVYKGAKVYDEAGIYVTLEESIPALMKSASSYGWDIGALENTGKLSFIDIRPAVGGQIRRIEPSDVFATISTQAKRNNAKRIVIDPISVFGMQTENPMQLRQDLLRFSSLLKQLDTTALFIAEIPEESQALSRFGVEEFFECQLLDSLDSALHFN